VVFGRGEELKYLSHLDLMRLWERAIRRTGLPLAYSEGFTPHPRLALAAPLPVGVTSSGELLDLFLCQRVSPRYFLQALRPQLPSGVDISRVEEVPLGGPSLQSLVRLAEYRVEVETRLSPGEISGRLAELMARESVPIQRPRPTGPKALDLRALVSELWLVEVKDGNCILGMRLRTGPQGSGRAEEVTAALGLGEPLTTHRERLVLEGES
jgi:radical SAM-linked protein